MDILEFALELFVRMGPNEQAWAATMMKYLKARGHEFATADSLHRRFANALLHYQVLVRLVNAEMAKIIDSFRDPLLVPSVSSTSLTSLPSGAPTSLGSSGPSVPSISSLPSAAPTSAGPLTYPVLDEMMPIPFQNYTNAHNSVGHVQDGPSIYLQSRCPFCFGGSHTSGLGVSTIACIDANFQIKRNHDKDRQKGFKGKTGARDPEIFSPRMVELSQVELDMMEARMMEDDRAVPGEDDAVEPGMNVLNSVLNMCGDSFIAADGNRIKASTQQFDDTGLMALLCRHDIALYVANMRTAGEKQFYAFALIMALFKELPEWWTVGIFCIVFGVLVFHVYGHQWTCQLWYHPQKSEIWGLSDGEGCERFWSELQRLIPSLRVTGYH
ncbi:hypothetical protein BS47DRAFT_1374422 [Hydnum rufescens UP504]|uniref:Uncharacterized protein n=1 Tax=Hydnum rufescens UP504 TaxID=1448309 RepID=A0A9P6AEG9_9AGAM|nr:hypothetical protein BS47DRAFT_1374422 [Hydnum rufescens UP504]